MDFILDTNILVHFVRNDAYIKQLEADFGIFSAPNTVMTSIISVGEIRSLAYQFGWATGKTQRLNYFINALKPFPIESPEIITAYADIDAFSLNVHPTIKPNPTRTDRTMGKNDLWIAATTHLLSATLLTTDNDFDHLAPQFFQIQKVVFRPV